MEIALILVVVLVGCFLGDLALLRARKRRHDGSR